MEARKCIIILLVLLSTILWADEEVMDEPTLETNITEDTETVEVPIEYLRHATWYYQQYFIERDLARDRLDIIEGLEKANESLEENLKTTGATTALLTDMGRMVRTLSYVAVGLLCCEVGIRLIGEIISWFS